MTRRSSPMAESRANLRQTAKSGPMPHSGRNRPVPKTCDVNCMRSGRQRWILTLAPPNLPRTRACTGNQSDHNAPTFLRRSSAPRSLTRRSRSDRGRSCRQTSCASQITRIYLRDRPDQSSCQIHRKTQDGWPQNLLLREGLQMMR